MARRFRRRPPLWLWFTAALFLLVVGRWFLSQRQSESPITARTFRVLRIVDGRTLQVEESGSATVRLLGVEVRDENAASTYLAEHLVGQTIDIELDKRRRDRDGAQLAYVYLGDTFINAELIRLGFAGHDAYPGDSASHAKLLREAK